MQQLVSDPRTLKKLYGMDLKEEMIKTEMTKFVPLIQSWSETYLDKGSNDFL